LACALVLLAAGAEALRGRATKPQVAGAKALYPHVNKLAQKIKTGKCSGEGDAWVEHCRFEHAGCTMEDTGDGWGGHAVCSNLIQKGKCGFLSYGISSDYSFDKKLEATFGCEGIGLDPTVTYPEKLPGTSVSFRKIGAPMLTESKFETQAPTVVAKSLNTTANLLLKMDCEGCEYAIANHVMKDDPKFFQKVDQFVLEAHVDQRFMSTKEHLKQYDSLLQLLDEAGLELMDARFTGCGEDMEFRGLRPPLVGPIRKSSWIQQRTHEKCLPELLQAGYKCSLNCQNFLFARTAK